MCNTTFVFTHTICVIEKEKVTCARMKKNLNFAKRKNKLVITFISRGKQSAHMLR